MTTAPHLEVSALCKAAEAAAPAEGVDAVASALAGMLGAKEVSFSLPTSAAVRWSG